MSGQAVLFVNFTKEDFSYPYGGISETFKAGSSRWLEQGQAMHFAKHLVDKELNRLEIRTDDPRAREKLLKKCFVEGSEIKSDKVETEVLNRNKESEKTEDKTKVVEHPKESKKEFPDLKDETTKS